MKPIEQDELFLNLKHFLKSKGIELQEGSYAHGIRRSCSLLSDAINLGQQGVERAKTEVDKKLDQMRRVIHEKTAPRKTAASAGSMPASPPPLATAQKGQTKTRPRKRKLAK